ncbi:MAG: alpha-N-acetylglucosaminidase N-terminal domain-containing protein, partial [Clostridia bacterium]|nr:alpha-N-acetylglucosaminidase N-terminal domain-containing protein [Clostridia bacterium]
MKKILSFLLAFVMVFAIVVPVIPEISLPAAAEETDPNDPDNLAYKKPTRSNSTTGKPENVVDGKDSTSWTGQDFPKYVDVDLMANYEISKISVVMPAGKWAYKIYGSLDGISYDEIASFDYATVTKGGNVHEFKDCTYRIVRVNVTNAPGGDWDNSKISEIRVYGKKSSTKVTETREKMEFTSYSEWLKENHGVTLKDGYTVEDTYTDKDTTDAVYGIVERILGAKYKNWFTFELAKSTNGNNFYEISMKNGKVLIKGDEGVSIATGLNYYLKYFCKVHVSQQTEQVTMPATIPQVKETVRVESPYEVRYAYNYCTLSYTMPFYGFDEWQRELDYLALSGVNVILDTTATEALWVM